jgi:signal transduction histidine kinase
MRFRGLSLETLIKIVLLALGVTLITVTVGLRLRNDYSSSEREARREMNSAISEIAGGSFPDEASLLDALSGRLRFWTPAPPAGACRKNAAHEIVVAKNGCSATMFLDSEKIWNELLSQNKEQIVLSFIAMIVSVQVASFLAYCVISPLSRLEWGFQQLSRDKRVLLPKCEMTANELVMLTDSFNSMSEKLGKWRDMQNKIARVDRLVSLGEMVAGIAHEIRNPLASMRIHLELLSEGFSAGSLAPNVGNRNNVERIVFLEEELSQMERTLNRFLDFAGYRSNKSEEINPEDIVNWVVNMVKTAKNSKVEIREVIEKRLSETSGEPPLFWGDKDKLRQSLLNLALNGLQAIDGGGTLTLHSSFSDANVVFSVHDTGRGVPENVKNRIFEPFVTTRPDGTGLGLPITRKYVEDHGGTLDFSTSPEGSCFSITIPMNTPEREWSHDRIMDS